MLCMSFRIIFMLILNILFSYLVICRPLLIPNKYLAMDQNFVSDIVNDRYTDGLSVFVSENDKKTNHLSLSLKKRNIRMR